MNKLEISYFEAPSTLEGVTINGIAGLADFNEKLAKIGYKMSESFMGVPLSPGDMCAKIAEKNLPDFEKAQLAYYVGHSMAYLSHTFGTKLMKAVVVPSVLDGHTTVASICQKVHTMATSPDAPESSALISLFLLGGLYFVLSSPEYYPEYKDFVE